MTKMEVLERIRRIAKEPYASALHWKKAEKRRVLGYYPMDFPEELFYAAGFVPFAVFGSNLPPTRADAHLQSFADSLARSFLHHGLAGDLDLLDGLVITHIDDTTRVLSSICRDNWQVPFFEDYLPPKRTDTSLARPYFIDEIQRLRGQLEASCRSSITEEALDSAIELCDRDRSLLREINKLRLQSPSLISNRDFFDAVKTSVLMPKEDHIDLMEDLLQGMQQKTAGKGATPQDPLLPILLTGYVCEPSDIYDLIDGMNGLIVADDLVSGSRYFERDVPQGKDPIERIVDRLIGLPPSPFFLSPASREAFLWDRLRQGGAKGVVFVQLKFCETYNYDYPNLRDFFRKKGIPTLLIETDLGMTTVSQIHTNLETFFEMIRGI